MENEKIMDPSHLDVGVLQLIMQGILPNATIPVLGRLEDLIHDLALDWDAFGIWFDKQIHTKQLSLQEIDLVEMTCQYIADDFIQYMQEQFQETPPHFEIVADDEDTYFTNWTEIINWINDLKEKNPQAWLNGFVQGMLAFDNKPIVLS